MEGKEVNMSSEIFGVMTIFACNSCYPMDEKSMRRANKLLKEYVKDPDVNRVRCMLVEDLQLAPLHWAIILGTLELLEIFLQSSVVDINVKPGGEARGNVLDMAVRASTNRGITTRVQMARKLLQVKDLQICKVGLMTELTPRQIDVCQKPTF